MNERNVIGLVELAKRFFISSLAVTNRLKRYKNEPSYIPGLKAEAQANEVDKILRRRKRVDTKIIAFINLKGGVAKTTTTVGMAQTLSGVHKKNVLVIDLDPQTNATTMLIGEDNWLELDKSGYTLATLFSDAITGREDFDLVNTLQSSVGDIQEVNSLDLLPSSLRLIDLQDKLITINSGPFGTRNPVEVLLRGIRDILHNYDYVLIDCPPNLGYITLNGLRIADGYIIPTIPDVMSTYGIPQIVTRISKFSSEIGTVTNKSIAPIGIIATKVRLQAPIHKRTLTEMRNKSGKAMGANSKLTYPMIFLSYFRESASIAEAAEYLDGKRTLRQKWSSAQFGSFEQFADEFIKVCAGL